MVRNIDGVIIRTLIFFLCSFFLLSIAQEGIEYAYTYT